MFFARAAFAFCAEGTFVALTARQTPSSRRHLRSALEVGMFGIGKRIEDAMKKAQEDPAGSIADHQKSLNSGMTGFMTKAFMGKNFVNQMNGVMDRGRDAMATMQERQQLMQTGADGTAEIVGVQDTGLTVNENPVVQIQMNVTPEAGEPYAANIQTMVSRIAVPRVGDKVKVKYAPANPQVVAIV
jgi:hypothetical protein